jgi:pre-mRNA-processing factor 17
MDLLQSAYSDSEDEGAQTLTSNQPTLKKVNIAPSVNTKGAIKAYEPPSSKQVYHNPEYDSLWAPSQGPLHPILSRPNSSGITGFVEQHYVDDTSFIDQYNAHNKRSYYFSDPSQQYSANIDAQITNNTSDKVKRKKFGDASDVSDNGFRGPWAGYEDEEQPEPEEETTEIEENKPTTKNTSQSEKKTEEPELKEELGPNGRPKQLVKARSIFHGDQFRDYLGRTFVDHPTDLKPTPHECFLPKRRIHTWSGHTKGVSAIRFFPKYGHLLLSAGMDSQVKVSALFFKFKS